MAAAALLSAAGVDRHDGVWRSGGREDLRVGEEVGVEVGCHRRVMTDGRNAADRIAGDRAHEICIGPVEGFSDDGSHLDRVDTVAARDEEQDRTSRILAAEDQ